MRKTVLSMPLVQSSCKLHQQIKQELLSLVDASAGNSVVTDLQDVSEDYTNISKTDWSNGQSLDRRWIATANKYVMPDFLEIYQSLGYVGFEIKEMWFQQYSTNSRHGYHVHGHNFTNIYYLELPEDSPKTIIVDPFNQDRVIELDVKEGDIVTFPSFVVHKTDANMSSKRKTIISFNSLVHFEFSERFRLLNAAV